MKQDHSSMKSWNRRTLVELLLSNGPKTRTWLSKITGLAPSAVTRLTRELMDIGILTFVQHENKVEPGRKGELLDLAQKPIAAVFDVGVTKTSFGLSFLNGKLDLISHFATPETSDEFFRIVKEKVNEMRNVYDFNILSFSIPGIVNMDSST
ncbi:MAG: ROK family transcriptional regulator, partial [Thermotogaceae bacterium]|nr:ROK family transcriptional regulator [Thermotogaceae bacterium]